MRLGLLSITCALAPLFTASCSTVGAGRPAEDLDTLTAWMAGSFDSQAQAAADADYRDIRLHMAPIFTSRTDGRWLYVEQALASATDKPYRQRVYHVHAEEGGFASDVFTLPADPLQYAGAWQNVDLLKDVTPASLIAREGCSIHLKRSADGSFVGSTDGRACPSELRGAQYATSKVTITASLLTSWDQGFDASGKQVWGAEKGPYLFVKNQ